MAADPNAQQWEQQAATGTGIPFAVTHQQAIAESGETDAPVSRAGARGFWQFLPSTYNPLAAQAGVKQGSWNNPADATKVYIVYMNQLLKQEGGSIFKALEAYNAGPGNLGAGAGYAAGIMSKAGIPQTTSAGTPGSAQTDTTTAAFPIPGIPDFGKLLDPATWFNTLGKTILDAFGVQSAKDMLQRLSLILFGAVLIIVGIRILSNSSKDSKDSKNGGGGLQRGSSDREKSPAKESKSSVKSLNGESAAASEGVGASEAIDAAAAA